MANRNTTQDKSYSVADIVNLRDCSINTVYNWIRSADVKPDYSKRIGGPRLTYLYSSEKINKILTYSPQYSYQSKKLDCAQLFVNGEPLSSIGYRVGLCRAAVAEIIKEFEDTGEITLESKLNFML